MSPAETKAALLESAVARVRERLEGDQADDVERFVRAYYANAAPDDLAGRTDLDLYGAAMAHWRLARLRRPGELKVNVYNPNVEEHGWQSPYTVVETVIADMPFLVDSVTMEVTRHGSAMHLVARPIMRLRRDEEGRLLEVDGEGGKPESLIHVEIDRITDVDALERLRADLARVLGDVAAAVEDWQAMRAEVHAAIAEIEQSPPPIPEEELAEARALLQWMHDDQAIHGYVVCLLLRSGWSCCVGARGSGATARPSRRGASASCGRTACRGSPSGRAAPAR